VGTIVGTPTSYSRAVWSPIGGNEVGKRARRRTRQHAAEIDLRRLSAEAVLARRSRSESLGELRRLADGRRAIDGRIGDVVDELVAKGVGWVPIAEALGVTRQAARQAFMRRNSSGR
jgi:hypothetical protein